jgi:uncharacterized membrane protein YbhN (UPF0104 family)
MSTPTPTPKRKSWPRRLIELVVVGVFVGFLVWAVARQWHDVRVVLGELTVPAVALASVTMLAGIWCSFLCWRAVLADFGCDVPVTGAMRIFFVGQAGKYLPGKLWPILTQARLGREYNVPARASSAAAAIFMLIYLATGLLVAVCTLPVLGPDAFGRYWWTLLALPAAVVVLMPPVLNRLLALALRVARRDPMPRPLTLRGIGASAGWAVVMWGLYGVHLWALLRDLGVDAPNLLLTSVGAFAGSWSIGFLMLVAPAGAGPREVALVLLLRTAAAEPQALVAAMVSRLLMTLGDLAWPGIALVAERRRRAALAERTPRPEPPPEPTDSEPTAPEPTAPAELDPAPAEPDPARAPASGPDKQGGAP